MADEVDVANTYAEVAVDMGVSVIRAKAQQQEVESTGSCLFCDEDLPEGHRWCDAKCRDTWEKRNKR